MKYASALAIALTLAACAGEKHAAFNPAQSENIRIASVAISIPPGAKFRWSEGEREFSGKKDDMRKALARKTKAHLNETLTPQFADGERPVDLIVGLVELDVVSAGRSVLVGGSHRMVWAAQVNDTETGETLATEGLKSVTLGNGNGSGGLIFTAIDAASGDPVDRLVAEMSEDVCVWLKGSERDCDM